MTSEYSSSDFEDNLCSKILDSRYEDLEYEYYVNTLLADNEITNDLIVDNVNFDADKDSNNMPKALKAIEVLKKQNHSLRSKLMVLTRDVPFMKALTSDQKMKLIIKLRLHLEKLITKCNQLKIYKKDDQRSLRSSMNNFQERSKVMNNLVEVKELKEQDSIGKSLSLHIDSQVERLLIENKYLRDKIEKLEKNNLNDKNRKINTDVMLIKTEFDIKVEDRKLENDFCSTKDLDNVIKLRYHVVEMKNNYEKLLKKHLETIKTLEKKEEKLKEIKQELEYFKNDKKM
uniref:DUF4201 domain-containing protein n=1 Tax=Parastrongyloides trichosuri TaxID=131310 RepID=A0A0N4Z530_PARTI